MSHRDTILIRSSTDRDASALARLAALDSAPPVRGQALVAEVDGELRAALPLTGGAPIADPFHRTLELVDLLRVRARQAEHPREEPTHRRRRLAALLPRAA